METNRDQAELIARVIVIEKQITDNEKQRDRLTNQLEELNKKMDDIKEDIRYHRDIPDIKLKLANVEAEMTNIKISVSELAPLKKMANVLISFILLAFIGIVWNTVIVQKPTDLNDLSKKIIMEYNKTNEK